MMRKPFFTSAISAAALMLTSCGGGGDSNNFGGTPSPSPAPAPTPTPIAIDGNGGAYTPPARESLTVTDVQTIIAQAVGEAQTRNLPSVIAVVDRVGNVLAVFDMNGSNNGSTEITISNRQIGGLAAPADLIGLQGQKVPAAAAAIAKAVTGAYLSSGGNAFSSRTASQIAQEHFPPAPTTVGLESGPLFGVQFSQLPCSDMSQRFNSMGGAGSLIGPKRSPLGLAADPGGLPLYKNGVVVGGIGVMGDGDYGFDPNILDVDVDDEEAIALAGIQGFAPPASITANRISVDGTSLRFSDMLVSDLSPLRSNFAAINNVAGALLTVKGYSNGSIIAGTAYGTEASGIRASTATEFKNSDAFVLTDGTGVNRYPIRGGTDAAAVTTPLSAAEVRAILEEAFIVISRARAQIRQPLDSRMQATVSVVDTHGQILGIVRTPDGPIFGTDVSLQKARTAAFFSSAIAAQELLATPVFAPFANVPVHVQRVRNFLGDPNALTGTVAFADRSGGNLSRPYFPDGEIGRPPGPLSIEQSAKFSPFAVGLQLDLVFPNIVQHVAFVRSNGASADTDQRCTQLPTIAGTGGQNRLSNGMQIFPGSVPIYRGDKLIGGVGVSGDGIDQDDMASFLGLYNAGQRVGTIGHAPKAIRADNVVVDLGNANVRLRYVNCPFAPFLDSNEQNVCEGL